MAAANAADLSSLPQADQVAIGATLVALRTGFQERDADKLVGVYSADADWVNAFGSVKQGSGEIVAYLRGLFADANFNAGTLRAPPEVAIRVLTPEVVLVSAHLQVEGQKLLAGGEIELRDNYSLRVLQRQPDGSWPIVSEMFNVANREAPSPPTPSAASVERWLLHGRLSDGPADRPFPFLVWTISSTLAWPAWRSCFPR